MIAEDGDSAGGDDANFNPREAKLSDSRYQLNLRYARPFDFGELALTVSSADNLAHHRRGFLLVADDDEATDGDDSGQVPSPPAGLSGDDDDDGTVGSQARGYQQRRHITDGYFDTHLTQRPVKSLTLVYGLDGNYGDAQQRTELYRYAIGPDGSRPDTRGTPYDSRTDLGVTRRYFGAYAQAQWRFAPRWDLTAGLRGNRTGETRRIHAVTVTPPEMDDPFDTTLANAGLAQGTTTVTDSRDSRHATRASGLLGLSRVLWRDGGGAGDFVSAYGSYRNTFKPADVDFGEAASPDILAPQAGQSVELGLKGKALGQALQFDVDAYLSRVKNVVIEDEEAGTLTNAGEEQVGGAELELRYLLRSRLAIFTDYTYTRATYRRLMLSGVDYAGNRLELIPEHEGALGLIYSQRDGPLASVSARAFGKRFLDRDNEVPLKAYLTLDASLGWNRRGYSLQLIGQNLSDQRPPVAVTEFGEDQYYLLPGRNLRVVFRAGF